MYLKRVFFVIISILILSACTNNQNDNALEPTGDRDLELVKLSSNGVADQNASNLAKEILSNDEEISEVRAVNHDNDLLIAINVDHHERFALDTIESELRKKINKNFSDMKVTLSTDQKILIELEQLENDIQGNDISKKQLKDRVKKLKSLSKEQT